MPKLHSATAELLRANSLFSVDGCSQLLNRITASRVPAIITGSTVKLEKQNKFNRLASQRSLVCSLPLVPQRQKIIKMLRPTLFVLVACSIAGFAHGMDCNLGQSKNIIDKYINSCPGPLSNSDLSYCCVDISKESFYCCDAEEFAIKTGLGIIIPAVIAVVVVVMFIIFCISCLCCSCCPWYRRRHRGTVYGKVQGPSVIQVIQAPGNTQTPQATSHNAYAYPANQMAMPNAGQAPPQYTAEAYSKQSPYNPTYGQ